MSEGPTSHSPLYSEGSPAVGSPLVNREIIVDISANPRERLPTVSASLAEPSIPVSMSVEGDSMDEVRFNQLFLLYCCFDVGCSHFSSNRPKSVALMVVYVRRPLVRSLINDGFKPFPYRFKKLVIMK